LGKKIGINSQQLIRENPSKVLSLYEPSPGITQVGQRK